MNNSNKEAMLNACQLREVLHYEPSTGVFTWATSSGGVQIGTVAGNTNSNGYMVIGIGGQKYRQHRLVWLYVYGEWPALTIDHIDGDRTNNRIGNLRCIPQEINMQNRRTASKANASGVLGVYWSERKGGYMASVTTGGKKKRRGPYRSIDRARTAYVALKRMLHTGCTL